MLIMPSTPPRMQRPLVGDAGRPTWAAASSPPTPGSPGPHPHLSHYESPFRTVDMSPTTCQSALACLSRLPALLNAFLSRHMSLSVVLGIACLLALLLLLPVLSREALHRWQPCRRRIRQWSRRGDVHDEEGAVDEKGRRRRRRDVVAVSGGPSENTQFAQSGCQGGAASLLWRGVRRWAQAGLVSSPEDVQQETAGLVLEHAGS